MDRLKALQTFLDVAKTESLSAVARDEGVTPAMVGRPPAPEVPADG